MNKQSEQAKRFIKENKQLLFDKFANPALFRPARIPITIFMAGSPGAGKTELSKEIVNNRLLGFFIEENAVRIDADGIREMIPGYDGTNTDVFKGASFIGVDILYSFVLKNKLHVVMDGTFSNYVKALNNVERALEKNRTVAIFYVYQDPLVAWEFTKIREKQEGRSVPLDFFVDSFFLAKENVNRIKSRFNGKVKVFLVIKDYRNEVAQIHVNIDSLDKYLKMEYTKEELILKLAQIKV